MECQFAEGDEKPCDVAAADRDNRQSGKGMLAPDRFGENEEEAC